MSTHRTIRESLYEYAMGELPAAERTAVEQHLASCPSCTADHQKLLQALSLVPRPADRPDAERPEEFWRSFPLAVEEAVAARERKRRFMWAERLRDTLQSLFVMRSGRIAAAGLSTAMAGLALVLLLRSAPADRGPAAGTTGTPPAARALQPESTTAGAELYGEADAAAGEGSPAGKSPLVDTGNRSTERSGLAPQARFASDRVTQYLRRSKVLLIGIANMPEETDSGLDLSAERKTSRALVKEARYLRQQENLDPHTRQLIDQLNRILIELANLADNNKAPGVELIRGGIRQENLLFRIRMAEVARDTTRYPRSSSMKGQI